MHKPAHAQVEVPLFVGRAPPSNQHQPPLGAPLAPEAHPGSNTPTPPMQSPYPLPPVGTQLLLLIPTRCHHCHHHTEHTLLHTPHLHHQAVGTHPLMVEDTSRKPPQTHILQEHTHMHPTHTHPTHPRTQRMLSLAPTHLRRTLAHSRARFQLRTPPCSPSHTQTQHPRVQPLLRILGQGAVGERGDGVATKHRHSPLHLNCPTTITPPLLVSRLLTWVRAKGASWTQRWEGV